MSSNDGSGIFTIRAWNTGNSQAQTTSSFDCKPNAVLYQYFLRQEPIPVLLLVDESARWNQQLENVYLVSCRIFSDEGHYSQHYEYELRPDPE
jgi:hypothetical protein